jgi:hypothetical protein
VFEAREYIARDTDWILSRREVTIQPEGYLSLVVRSLADPLHGHGGGARACEKKK